MNDETIVASLPSKETFERFHQQFIEVARSMDPCLLQGVRNLLERAILEATSFDAFQKQVKDLIASHADKHGGKS